MKKTIITKSLISKYPPSEPCSCDTCKSYCQRPGWWTVDEAERAILSGLANRMMLEISPDRSFGVLSPAFKGNETNFALQKLSKNGCTFFKNDLCELFGTGLQPLECRFCHHTRRGQGKICHSDIEKDWITKSAKILILKWGNKIGLWNKYGFMLKEK
ncbi:MAG: hypothetical protein A2W99_03405 [Bacteroidetes bacterium GWF2_33_16]|nr:MAG: hypothetical protein A2X00_11665 [Bacteroidetes bacterium GWE2_32_14]OFY08234.1 MAG: hypothetical protein A2W99_03405 [Bacteroidetes bacterium GWF2_33_16]